MFKRDPEGPPVHAANPGPPQRSMVAACAVEIEGSGYESEAGQEERGPITHSLPGSIVAVQAGGALRKSMVTARAYGFERIWDLRRRAGESLQEARYPCPRSWILGQEGGGESRPPKAKAEASNVRLDHPALLNHDQ